DPATVGLDIATPLDDGQRGGQRAGAVADRHADPLGAEVDAEDPHISLPAGPQPRLLDGVRAAPGLRRSAAIAAVAVLTTPGPAADPAARAPMPERCRSHQRH